MKALAYLPLGVLVLCARAHAQGGTELTAREKTEVFIQHLVRVAKIEPTRYRSLVLEYEMGTALTELWKAHAEEGDEGHEGHAHEGAAEHSAGDACSTASGMSLVEQQGFIHSALCEVHPEYAQLAKLFQDGKLAEAREAARGLALKADPYLVAHAALLEAECQYQLARQGTDPTLHEKTIALCEKISQRDRMYLLNDYRACELIAQSFLELKKPLLEATQYALLLTDYNELPPEVADRARQRLQALESEAGRPLGKVAGWMNEVEKHLAAEQTGKDPTQSKEVEIVSALDKLIELQEARERKT